eukprot:maker-scaffold593_size129216-snap-gene-0.25 protein:Tk12025 transcript:maker-scaffold593_size129216-snap-gene-0.25-mRNA-1 annotation:"signal peptide protein"
MGVMASICATTEAHSDSKVDFTDCNMNPMFLGAIYSTSVRTNICLEQQDCWKDKEPALQPSSEDEVESEEEITLTPESKELLLYSSRTTQELLQDIPWIEEDAISVKTVDIVFNVAK